MDYWIKPVLDDEGRPSKEVTVVDDDDRVVARGGLQVEAVIVPQGVTVQSFDVRFVGAVVE